MKSITLCLSLIFVTISIPDDAFAFHDGVTGGDVAHGVAYAAGAAVAGLFIYAFYRGVVGPPLWSLTSRDMNPNERYAISLPAKNDVMSKGPRKAKLRTLMRPTYASLQPLE